MISRMSTPRKLAKLLWEIIFPFEIEGDLWCDFFHGKHHESFDGGYAGVLGWCLIGDCHCLKCNRRWRAR